MARKVTSRILGARTVEIIEPFLDMGGDLGAQLADMSAEPSRQVEARINEWLDLAWWVYARAGVPLEIEHAAQYWLLPDGTLAPLHDVADYRSGYGHVFASGIPAQLGLPDDEGLGVAALLMQFSHVVRDRLDGLQENAAPSQAVALAAAVIQAEKAWAATLEFFGVDPNTATPNNPEGRTWSDAVIALRASTSRAREANRTVSDRAADRDRKLALIAKEIEAEHPHKSNKQKAKFLRERAQKDWSSKNLGQLPEANTLRNKWRTLVGETP